MRIERTKNATRNIVFGTVLKLYQIILPFFMRTIMVYTLGVEYLGLNSLFTSILQVLNLAELGVGSAMVFSMYKPIVDEDKITICALMNLYKWYYRIIGGVVLVIGLILTPFIPNLINGEIPSDINVYILYLLNLFATVLTYWLFAYKNSILHAHQRTDVVSKVTICTDTFKYIFQIAALFILHNYYYYVIVILLTQILTNIATAMASQRLYPQYNAVGKLSKGNIKEINGKIKDLFTAKLGGTIVNSADTIVISAFLGLTTLAVYQNYYFIMVSLIGFITILLNSCTAGIGNSILMESEEKNYNDFKIFAFMQIWVAGICVCCLLNLYQPFMIFWMGEKNLLSFGCVILLCIYFYLYITNQFFCTYKDAAGIWHEDRFRPLVGAIVNLSLNIILVRYIGIFAIILSTVISYLMITTPWLIYNLFTILFKRSYMEFLKNFFYYSLVVFLAAVVTYTLSSIFDEATIICLVIRFIISFLLSNIIFLLILGRCEEFNGAIDMFNRITKGKFSIVLIKLKR
ncbi:polysaccharide biosynthesis protein [Faecalitalea cylindroides]|uniref:polysaccharide biosynthesis protein n=1 Tax=Faecalitalea cylindroides TaxID=39483 RepID=UPI00195C3D03|nr:polysaccharide biosynthesis protein [Faecalitalea cylindroides]MBM6810018.1 polysaccharide biosynthesis protein [Faecalitalea cylindroides]